MKHEREMKEDKDKKSGERTRERERVCNGAEYLGHNYLVTGDKLTQEETEV